MHVFEIVIAIGLLTRISVLAFLTGPILPVSVLAVTILAVTILGRTEVFAPAESHGDRHRLIVAHDLKLPIRYVGVGEAVDDLLPFSPREYVDAIFQEKW